MFASGRDLHDTVCRVAAANRVGGRVVSIDGRTVVVYDASSWGDDLSERVRAAVPDCSVRYQASETSLSGFNIVFVLTETPWCSWIVAIIVITIGIVLTVLKGGHGAATPLWSEL